MRTVLGVLALIVGLVVLFWYGAEKNAMRMEQAVADGANGAVAGSVHGVKTTVSGRDIEVSGLADSTEERDQILKTLESVQGRRVVRDKMTVIETASPYKFTAIKKSDGVTVSGNIPTEEARAGIAVALDGEAPDLKVASGAPEDWTLVAEDGIAALSKMELGTFSMSDKTLTLEGLAQNPKEAEAALAELKDVPEGYSVNSSFDYLDDGKPANFTLSYSASDGASVDGKLPAGLSVAAIAKALGLDKVSGNPDVATTGSAKPTLSILEKLKSWLPEFDALKLSLGRSGGDNDFELTGGDDDFGFAGEASPGADVELIKKRLTEAFGNGVAVTVEEETDLPPEGTSRENVATGETEVLTSGYWLPQMDFEADYDTCRDRAQSLLSKRDVNFVTGSARLDARSLRVINAMTSLVMKCVQSGALKVEVGGHTDTQGESAFNMDLSQKRADAVVAALEARGIPEAEIVAAGYGDTKPIADNDTEEGRAANRRVTLVFSQ